MYEVCTVYIKYTSYTNYTSIIHQAHRAHTHTPSTLCTLRTPTTLCTLYSPTAPYTPHTTTTIAINVLFAKIVFGQPPSAISISPALFLSLLLSLSSDPKQRFLELVQFVSPSLLLSHLFVSWAVPLGMYMYTSYQDS